MRKPLVAGNWKMHGSAAFVDAYAAALLASDLPSQIELLLLPPVCYLSRLIAGLRGLPVATGAQDVHWEASGAFTGETSAAMVAELGAVWTLVGHSERRSGQGETDATVAAKAVAALDAGLSVIVCVGENLAEREAGSAEAVVMRQLDAVASLAGADVATISIAYEPVWAIGTGRTATPGQAQAMHELIRARWARYCAGGQNVRVLYGGSVTPSNAAELFGQPDVDGALVGGASLDAGNFLKIAEAAAATLQHERD